MADIDDLMLIAKLKQGDPAAFEDMVRRFSPRLLSSATRVLGNPDEARDAVQEALISTWRNIGQFEGTSALYTWLHRIVINACLGRMRSARAKKEVSISDDERPIAAAFEGLRGAWTEVGPNLEKRTAMRHAIQRALRKIPEEFRIVLLLRDVEELSSKETADHLGIPDALVRQRLHRARTIMAEMLRPELCSGPELTCGGQLDLLLDYVDNSLPANLQRPVHDHIESCPACTNLLTTYRTTIGIPRAIVELTIEEVDAAFVQRIINEGKRPTLRV